MNEAMQYLALGHNGILVLAKRGVIDKSQIPEFAPWRVSCAQLDSESVQNVVKTLRASGRLPKGDGQSISAVFSTQSNGLRPT